MGLTVKDNEREERIRRVRVGLTGLAAVVVLVLLATAILSRLAPTSGPVAAVASSTGEDEPLAELGVAPGAPDNAVANAATPKDVPR